MHKMIFMTILCVVSCLAAPLAQAAMGLTEQKKNLVLLVSLDPKFYPQGLAASVHDYRKYPAKLEATFREAWAGSDFNIQVIQNANRDDLYQALHSSVNAGVFWVSHADPIARSGSAVEVDPMLVDLNGADVKDVLDRINPDIKWVSLVACDSNVVIHWLKQSYSLHGIDHITDANRGLKQAIQQSQSVLLKTQGDTSQGIDSNCIQKQGYPITVHRELNATESGQQFFPAVTIEVGGIPIGAFPELILSSGESQSQDTVIYLSPTHQPLDPNALKILIQSGFDPQAMPSGFALGNFSVIGGWSGASWKTFALPDGTPVGVTHQTMHYQGVAEIAPNESPILRNDFECNP